jgi:hypothetical protein
VVYDQYGRKPPELIIGLSNDFIAVKDAIVNLKAFDHQEPPYHDCPTSPITCGRQTNIGDGIMFAHNYIASEGRLDAIWSMVLLTDGKANIYRRCPDCDPPITTCPVGALCWCDYEPCVPAETWAIYNAKDTWTRHESVIYTIAFGKVWSTYKDLMIVIADWTDNGALDGSTTETEGNFWGVPSGVELQAAFVEISQRIYSRLLH